MATTTVTLTGNVHDVIDGTFDARRTKVYVKHNTEYVVDPDAGVIRLGSATVTPNDDGTFEIPDVIASVSTVENLQATVYVDYADPMSRERKRQPFGPYDLTAETGTVALTTLEQVQHLDPTYVSVTMAAMQALLDAMEEISGLTGEDSAVAGLISNPLLGVLTGPALATAIEDQIQETVVKLAGNYAGANDRAKIVAAITDAQATGATTVRLNRRPLTSVWSFSGAAITVPNGLTIEAEPGVTVSVNGVPSDGKVFYATGTEGSKVNLTSDAAAGSLSVTLPTGQGANFAAGDLLAIEANNIIFTADGTNGRPREIQRVLSVSGDVVLFCTPLLDAYTVANAAQFSKVTPVTVRFRGLRFTNTAPLTNVGYAIEVDYGDGCYVDDATVTNMGGGVQLRECIDTYVNRYTVDRLPNYDTGVNLAFGYGLALVGACSSIEVNGLTGRSVRHLFTTVGLFRSTTPWGYPKHITVNEAIGTGDQYSLAIFDTHEAGKDITFNNCRAIGGGTSCAGFQMRAKDVKLNNCIADRNGFRALSTTANATGLRVNGGHYTRAAANGMSLQANDIQVAGAEVASSGNAGIILTAGITSPVIQGCRIIDNGQVSAGYGIQDQGTTNPVYVGNIIPKSTTQIVSILSIPATGVATNNTCMGYGTTSWGFTSAHASSIRDGNHGDGGTETTGGVKIIGKAATAASATTGAGLSIPHGTAPTSPVNGDFWTTTAGLFARINGSTINYGAGGGSSASQFDYLSTLGMHPAIFAAAASTSLTLNTANNAILVPIKPDRNMSITKMTWTSRTQSGNYDIGIYDNSGTLLWSKTSTAWPASSTSAAIVETFSSVALTAGTVYWVAFAADNTTGAFQGSSQFTSVADSMRLADGTSFARVVASAFPLPSTITIGSTASPRMPGISLRES